MKKNIYFTLISIFLLTQSFSTFAKSNDFKLLCTAFDQLDKLKDVQKMSNIQRNDFILKNIRKTLAISSNARNAWVAVDSVVAGMRYELITNAAESALNKKWRCPSMQKWARQTGEF